MKLVNLFISLLLLVCFTSCSNEKIKYEKTKSGLEYHYFDRADTGKLGKPGDYYLLDVIGQREDDSIFINSYKMGQKIKFMRSGPPFHSLFNDGLAMLKIGDSIIFKMPADSFFSPLGQTFPNYLRKNEVVRFTIKVNDILNPDAHLVKMFEYELVKMMEYLDQKKWKYSTDSTGIKYEVLKPGNSVQAAVGDEVEVSYLLTYLDGKIIDRTKPGDVIRFVVGAPETINGLSRLVMLCSEGSKVQAVIPFSEGFGEEGSTYVDPYATLVIEMDIVKVIKKK